METIDKGTTIGAHRSNDWHANDKSEIDSDEMCCIKSPSHLLAKQPPNRVLPNHQKRKDYDKQFFKVRIFANEEDI